MDLGIGWEFDLVVVLPALVVIVAACLYGRLCITRSRRQKRHEQAREGFYAALADEELTYRQQLRVFLQLEETAAV